MVSEKMPTKPHPQAAIYHADEAELTGGAKVESAHKGFTGKGYVSGYLGSATAATTFLVNVPADGEYYISLRYAAGAAGNWNTDRTVGLCINDGEVRPVVFKSFKQDWDSWDENVQKVSLLKGENRITYRCLTEDDNSDCINLDKLSVWAHDPNPVITNIVFDSDPYILSENYSIQSKVLELDSNGISKENTLPITFSSSDPAIMSVDAKTGLIKAHKAGTAVIKAESGEFTAEAVVKIEGTPMIAVDCSSTTRPVNPSQFGYILTPNYDVPDSRMTLLGPLLNRETFPVQNFQAISDLDGSYYVYENSILQRCLEAYKRAKGNGLKWYWMLGMSPSWAAPSGAPIDTMKNEHRKDATQQARFKQYVKDFMQYFKDNGAKPDFANLTNEYWTGTEKTYKGNWEAVREVYPDFIPTVGPGGVGFDGIPDFYIPYVSENNITLEGPAWHSFWINDRYATFAQLEEWTGVIKDYQEKFPEANGKYIVWEENNAGSQDPTDWTRSMSNAIRAGVTQNIKGCLEVHNANGMSDLITTNVVEKNPAARRPLWWVYYAFSQMSGYYVELTTKGTEDFSAAASVDTSETKIIFAKNDCSGSVELLLTDQPYAGENIYIDLYKITESENNGLEFQYSLEPITNAPTDLKLQIDEINANESWMVLIKKQDATPSFFHQMLPDDGEIVLNKPTLSWSKARGAVKYTVKIATDKELANVIITRSGLSETSYTLDSELEVGQKYYWTVVAENEYGTRAVSNNAVYSFQVGENVDVPGQFGPYLPSLNAPNQSITPEFQWSRSYNATSFRLVVSKNEDLSDPVITKQNLTSVRDTGQFGPNSLMYHKLQEELEYDTCYYWAVYAVNGNGERKMTGPLRHFTTRAEGDGPKEFKLLAPKEGETDVNARTVISWEESKNAFFYKLQISTKPDLSDPILVRDRMIYNRYTVEPNLLEPNTKYYWGVTAYTKDLEYEQVTTDGIRSFKTEAVPCSPLLYATQEGNGSVTLWFQPITGVKSYKILYGTESKQYSKEVDKVKTSPYTITGLEKGTKYYFAVVAENENGTSSIWNERSATT